MQMQINVNGNVYAEGRKQNVHERFILYGAKLKASALGLKRTAYAIDLRHHTLYSYNCFII